MKANTKQILTIVLIILASIFLFEMITVKPKEVIFSDFIQQVESGSISEVVVQGMQINFKDTSGNVRSSTIPRNYPKLVETLQKAGVHFQVKASNSGGLLLAILSSWLPIVLIVGVWLFFMRQMGGESKIMQFNKTKEKDTNMIQPTVTFADVAGIDEAKEELDEIVAFLKDPERFNKLGGKIPAGVLLVGEPGTGKTLLAKAVAGEAQVSFFDISGSDFVEMFVGVGASRVRSLFAKARESAPCIIFVDEIDAVGRHRGTGLGGGNDEREQTLNQLLVEIDGFSKNSGVIVMAATNRPDVLDPALLRPGRFDRQVVVPKPDVVGREQILRVHTKNMPLEEGLDLREVARAMPGFTGADISNLVNEAALNAARNNQDKITISDFHVVRDRIMLGKERRSMLLTDEEKKITAYHEAGHALIAAISEELDPLHKVTIVPRGKALGVTLLLPEQDKYLYTQKQLLHMMVMLMGGRAAEELLFNHFTTGASNDLERCNQIARQMVCSWGMIEEMGAVSYQANSQESYLGKDMLSTKRISMKRKNLIDKRVKMIIDAAYAKAYQLFEEQKDLLVQIGDKLLEEETISGAAVLELVKNKGLSLDD